MTASAHLEGGPDKADRTFATSLGIGRGTIICWPCGAESSSNVPSYGIKADGLCADGLSTIGSAILVCTEVFAALSAMQGRLPGN